MRDALLVFSLSLEISEEIKIIFGILEFFGFKCFKVCYVNCINPLLWLLMINCILNTDAYFLQNTIQRKFYQYFSSPLHYCPNCFQETILLKKNSIWKTTPCNSLSSKNHDFKSSFLALALVLTRNFCFPISLSALHHIG